MNDSNYYGQAFDKLDEVFHRSRETLEENEHGDMIGYQSIAYYEDGTVNTDFGVHKTAEDIIPEVLSLMHYCLFVNVADHYDSNVQNIVSEFSRWVLSGDAQYMFEMMEEMDEFINELESDDE